MELIDERCRSCTYCDEEDGSCSMGGNGFGIDKGAWYWCNGSEYKEDK